MAAKRRKKRRAKRRKAPSYVRKKRQVGRGLKAVPTRSAALRGRTPYEELALQRSLAKSYEEQLDEIGEVLIRHGIISKVAVERDGVRFAVLRKFEPVEEAYLSKRPRP